MADGKVNAALNTAAGAAHDERSVTLTREQWEALAALVHLKVRLDEYRSPKDYAFLCGVLSAICDQAGLPEVFRCE